MQINQIIRTLVGADYAHEQNIPSIRRCRFIAHTADLSAQGGCSYIRIILLKGIIVPNADLSASMDIPLSGLCSKCALLRPSCPLETPETLDTVSHYDSNLSKTPDTPDTPDTVSHYDSNLPDTPDTLDTLETLENGHRVGPNSLRPRRKTWSVSTMHVA